MKHNIFFSVTLSCVLLCAGSRGYAEEAATDKPASKTEETSSEKPGTYYLCKLNNVVRTVRLVTDKNGVCEATYTKEGVDKVVGKSGTPDRCLKVISNIKENLEKASWKCKDISQARVSSSLND
jgi:hypothetical protein